MCDKTVSDHYLRKMWEYWINERSVEFTPSAKSCALTKQEANVLYEHISNRQTSPYFQDIDPSDNYVTSFIEFTQFSHTMSLIEKKSKRRKRRKKKVFELRERGEEEKGEDYKGDKGRCYSKIVVKNDGENDVQMQDKKKW